VGFTPNDIAPLFQPALGGIQQMCSCRKNFGSGKRTFDSDNDFGAEK
jgi:hypothetical protein